MLKTIFGSGIVMLAVAASLSFGISSNAAADAAYDATPSDAVFSDVTNDENTDTKTYTDRDAAGYSDTVTTGYSVPNASGYTDTETYTDTEASGYIHILDGVDYSKVYDYYYYTERYPDMKRVFGDDQEKVLRHFVNFGMKEKRQGNDSFDVQSYIFANPDLRAAYRNNYARYYTHFLYFGCNENRASKDVTGMVNPVTVYNGTDYAAVFDYKEYALNNKKVKIALNFDNDYGLLENFVKEGMKAKRQGNNSFDVKSYANQYPDLRSAFGSNWERYYTHYMNFGKNEGRTATGVTELQNPTTVYKGTDYSKVYDYKDYTRYYPDIAAAFECDDQGALQHFVLHGMNEKRTAKSSFEIYSYVNAYKDLRNVYGINFSKYYYHYMNFGAAEGRVATGVKEMAGYETKHILGDYGAVYDYNYYLKYHPDVAKLYALDEKAVLNHFVRYGIREGRVSKENVDKAVLAEKKKLSEALFGKGYKDGWLKFDPTFKTKYANARDLKGWAAYDAAAYFYKFDKKGDIIVCQKEAPRLVEMPGFYISPMYTGNLNSSEERIEAMIRRAYDYYGDPYTGYTSAEPHNKGVDCSGLTMQCLYAAGFDPYPATPERHVYVGYCSRVLWEEHSMMHISVNNNDYSHLKRGDLVYQKGLYTPLVTHVAIYLGNGQVIEAWPGDGVTDKMGIIHKIQPHDLRGATRPFP